MPKSSKTATVELSKNDLTKILREWIFSPAAEECPRPQCGIANVSVDLHDGGATLTYSL